MLAATIVLIVGTTASFCCVHLMGRLLGICERLLEGFGVLAIDPKVCLGSDSAAHRVAGFDRQS